MGRGRPDRGTHRRRRADDDPRSGSSQGIRADIASDPEPDPESVARTIVLNQLTTRARSRGELSTTLARRGVPDEVARRVLDRMEQVGLVDDAEFAQEWVRSRHTTRGLSGRALRAELHSKGVDPEQAAAAVGSLDAETEYDTARELAQRKLRAMPGVAPEVAMRRLAGMLARKGYQSDLAYQVVRDTVAGAASNGDP